jgi:hypothetical protein
VAVATNSGYDMLFSAGSYAVKAPIRLPHPRA